tara:strand:+ start:464 stop:1180 length:717 start_codon:yes stop_codon:yes gene_type:complete
MHLENKYLITGVNSGLGRHLSSTFENAICINRQNADQILKENVKIDTILHCAFNSRRGEEYYKYYCDNLKFTSKLCEIPHKKFIYMSSVDAGAITQTDYSIFKRISESIVLNEANKPLILRLGALIGNQMRKNNVSKIMLDEKPILSLHKDSNFSFVSYGHIVNIIKKAKVSGVYDLVSSDIISVENIAKIFKKENKISYGKFKYLTPLTNGGIIEDITGIKQQTCRKVLEEFYFDKE